MKLERNINGIIAVALIGHLLICPAWGQEVSIKAIQAKSESVPQKICRQVGSCSTIYYCRDMHPLCKTQAEWDRYDGVATYKGKSDPAITGAMSR